MDKSNRLFAFEESTRVRGFHFIAGVDEAGRGPLAGPVVAAAVILPGTCALNGLDDSKKLSQKQRENLFPLIKKEAVSVGVGVVSHRVVDEINILEATKKAMQKAILNLKKAPEYLLVDGKIPLDNVTIRQETIVRGDSKSASIASASIIAKVIRDRIMKGYDKVFPDYSFASHKGYATRIHKDAIKNFGICDIHRKTFKGVKEYV